MGMKLSFVLFSQAANGSAGKLPRLRLYRHGRVLAGAAGGATRFQDYPLQIATNAQRLVSGFTYTLLLTIPSSLYADWTCINQERGINGMSLSCASSPVVSTYSVDGWMMSFDWILLYTSKER